jgi:hypothetical protein
MSIQKVVSIHNSTIFVACQRMCALAIAGAGKVEVWPRHSSLLIFGASTMTSAKLLARNLRRLESLPLIQQEALTIFFLYGLPDELAADAMGVTPAEFREIVQNALTALDCEYQLLAA